MPIVLVQVFFKKEWNCLAAKDGSGDSALSFLTEYVNSEWCPLLPAEEVEKAFNEGVTIGVKLAVDGKIRLGFDTLKHWNHQWLQSNARKIVEGDV